MTENKYEPSVDVKAKLDSFQQADDEFRRVWEDFESKNKTALEYIDKLREDRNAKLDAATRVLRSEVSDLDINKYKTVRVGPFQVQKKFSKWFIPERFLAIVKALGLTDAAISGGAIVQKIEIPFEQAGIWAKEHSCVDKVAEAEDGKELTPAVTGPKPIPAFGVGVK